MKHNSSEHNDLIEWALKELDSLNEEIGFELDLSELDEEIFWQITDDAYESYVGVYDPERGKFNNFQEPVGLYFECFLKGLCATEVFQEALIH
ncbi:MAG: hypothetical protein OXU24_02050, partial [Gammaproteobacteria bacterium]|nr:hypothetical protein [Gammaproteobacteria bacterium]